MEDPTSFMIHTVDLNNGSVKLTVENTALPIHKSDLSTETHAFVFKFQFQFR